ncbi:hypothetical protein COU78_06195 [Candidatus Peregrinibacteria bacterium CG10_big_fil_rev_8_21_14_0_10_49_24]|nr:MAG: hypothetical protein COV83_03030 [Candidatus Peregrinibacteria bacterium CG11_big_fil_rev_8_21_14_0_20_49_14]PIR50446.1 MAG: hypothetical protein COU78_06195 [Candidatus Peregrinibacteria bacterium CG10_big_fil_rev_8_21_14_0_10_49_24]PJA68282.1 MAG: hypothetical protein CO157_00185 [Candidatus Peregrinibacteria bacterium CG_4_9_14_3_um_filter_49_12]
MYRRQFFPTLFGVTGLMLLSSTAYAADRHWVGAVNNSDRWEDTNNWSTSPKGATGASVPGASDTAIFSYSGSTVTIRSAVNVGGIELNNVWTGAVLQGTGTLTVGSSGISIGGGTFTGGNARINTSGNFTQTGGTVTGLQNTVTLSGSLAISAGVTFTATGTFVFNGGTQTVDTNNATIASITIASGTSTTFSSNHSVTGTVQINTGSTLALGSNTLFATGASIINFATLNEGTGKVTHTATSFIVSDSTYLAAQSSFPLGATVYFSLTEQDENISGTAQDTVSITVSLGNGDSETVTLTETNNTSAQFTGSIPSANSSPTSENGTLEAANGQLITITFTDAQDALASTDTADLASTSSPTTGTGSHGGAGKAARLQLLRARQAQEALKGAAPESDEPVVKVDMTPSKMAVRTVERQQEDIVSPEVQRIQNRLNAHVLQQNNSQNRAIPVREVVSESFKGRVCDRVMRWFKSDEKMLDRVNRRLEGRFGFMCVE